jgi:hypothetical protein
LLLYEGVLRVSASRSHSTMVVPACGISTKSDKTVYPNRLC